MTQYIIVAILFLGALTYFGRHLYRQIKAGRNKEPYCDKCIPKNASQKGK